VPDLANVPAAIVRIETTGEFRAPNGPDIVNPPLGAGAGSGFAIDAEGHVLTGSWVVQGATTVAVYATGESVPRTAQIVAVDECVGIALLHVDGTPLPYLSWYDQDRVRDNLDLYLAGYSTGATEVTLMPGEVTNERTEGSNAWAAPGASLRTSIEPVNGTSGGPVVDAEGHVVAVSYPTDPNEQASGSLALFAGRVVPLVETLKTGVSRGTGLNVQAVVADTGYAGLWVSAVAANSPAQQGGLRPGDIIHTADSDTLVSADRPSLGNYCELVDTATFAAAPLETFRYDTGETFAGTANNLRPTGTPRLLEGNVTAGAPIVWKGGTLDNTPTVDDLAVIYTDIPTTWNDKKTAPVIVDQTQAAFLLASSDVDGFEIGNRAVPGVRITATSAYAPSKYTFEQLIAQTADRAGVTADCEQATVLSFQQAALPGNGSVATYINCGGLNTRYTIVAGSLRQGGSGTDTGGYTIELVTVNNVGHAAIGDQLQRILIAHP
jgi:S1-C subfamily serine protease